jgi:hypothetical protein
MSALNERGFNTLLDDIKIISKAVKILRDEHNPNARQYACNLVNDLLLRLSRDVEETTPTLLKYDQNKLLFDIGVIKDSVQIVRDENNYKNREFACELVEKLVDKLFSDMQEMKETITKEP